MNYLETLPKDIIGYLRGFTGPTQLYHIPYQLKKYGSFANYSLYATTMEVRDKIIKIIDNLSFSDYEPFIKLYAKNIVSLYRLCNDTIVPIQDPIETIKIEDTIYFITPIKKESTLVFEKVSEFKELVKTNLQKKCKTIGCRSFRPQGLDYCHRCVGIGQVKDPRRLRQLGRIKKPDRFTPGKLRGVPKIHPSMLRKFNN